MVGKKDVPGWIRIQNNIGEHPKSLELEPDEYLSALGLLMLLIGWCDDQSTDGLVSKKALPRIAPGSDYERPLKALRRVGFVEDDDGGYRVHDYLDWQQSRAEKEAHSKLQREKAEKRWNAAGNAAGNADGNAGGNADRQTDDTYIAEQTDAESEAAWNEQVQNIVAVASGRLYTGKADELMGDFGYSITLEAVRAANKKADAGERISNYPALATSIARTMYRERR